MSGPLAVAAIDYHTAGEPFRIVEGLPLRGRTVAERRHDAAESFDHYRRLLTAEPRGHSGMYGGFVTVPDDPGGDLGVVFYHKDGFSTACGHGTIALAVWALDSGRIPARIHDGEQTLHIDVPSGRVQARVQVRDGRAQRATFRNVPAWVAARKVPVRTTAGDLVADVAFGGAFYASLPRPAHLAAAGHLPALIALAREIRDEIDAAGAAEHPDRSDLSGVYGVMFHDPMTTDGDRPAQRSITVFADGAVDRSPCGSGTSARLALLYESGELACGQDLVHRGASGSPFLARVTGTRDGAGRAGDEAGRTRDGAGRTLVDTEVEGTAYLTGYHQFVLDPRDDLGHGFQLS